MSPGWQAGICETAAVWFRQLSAGVPNRWRASQVAPLRFPGDGLVPPNPLAGVPIGRRASQVAPLRSLVGGLSIVGATFMSPGWQVGICGTAAVWFRQSVGGRIKPSAGVTSGVPAFPRRRFGSAKSVGGRHKWRPCVSRAAVWFRQIGLRASQVAFLRFLGGGLVPPNRSAGVTSGAPTFLGRRFVNRRGDIHVARVAGGNMQDRGSLVPPIGWRAYQTVYGRHKWRPYVSRAAVWFRQSVGGRAKPSTGVTSGVPTSPGRRFVNRRGDIHVARVAGGNMRERWIETSARGRQEYIK